MTTVGGDGRFNIERGQGLSQAIIKELGIEANSDDAKKLNSVWGKIFNLVETENNKRENGNKIYSGGSDLKGPSSKNFVMTIGQAVDLSNIWEQIKTLVQNAGAKMNQTPTDNEKPPADNKAVDTTNTGTPNATATLEETKKEADSVATELRTLFNDGSVSEMRGELAKITPENVAYVLDKYKSFYAQGTGDIASLAGRIRGINAMGNGFDKKEVGEYIVRPLLIRAKALGIKCDLMQGKNIEDLSFKEMCAVIRDLQPKIAEKDSSNFIPQQNANYNEAIAVLNTGNVTNINSNEDNTIKTIKLKTGHSIRVEYDGNNEIKNIYMNLESLHQLTGYEEGSNKPTTDDLYDICFTNDSVRTDQNYNNNRSENLAVQDYDFVTIKALVQKLLDSQETS